MVYVSPSYPCACFPEAKGSVILRSENSCDSYTRWSRDHSVTSSTVKSSVVDPGRLGRNDGDVLLSPERKKRFRACVALAPT